MSVESIVSHRQIGHKLRCSDHLSSALRRVGSKYLFRTTVVEDYTRAVKAARWAPSDDATTGARQRAYVHGGKASLGLRNLIEVFYIG
jgi:hypothetical protein